MNEMDFKLESTNYIVVRQNMNFICFYKSIYKNASRYEAITGMIVTVQGLTNKFLVMSLKVRVRESRHFCHVTSAELSLPLNLLFIDHKAGR